MEELNEKDLERMLTELESLTKELESGNLSLEDGLTRFEEGVACYKNCKKMLRKVEKKVKILVDDLREEEFD